jgi:hypothetical protein
MAVSSRRPSGAFRRGFITLAAASTCALVIASSAQAATVTVGSPLIGSFKQEGPIEASGEVGTAANLALGDSGAIATSPVDGVIVRWHLLEGEGGPFRLRILRGTGGPVYTAVGSSAPVTASGIKFETFTTSLPIRAGDTIGLDLPVGAKIGVDTKAPPASVFAIWKPMLGEGATLPYSEAAGSGEWGFNAEVQPAPSVASIAPASGSIKGKTEVTISGEDFAGVSGVSFGGAPATSFSVGSETSITAVVPPRAKIGGVDVTVTTAAGTSPLVATDQFTYTACVVPKLKGKKLKAAKKKLTKANCKLGKLKGQKTKSAKVTKQSPKPGKVLAPGAKVGVKLAG